MASSSSEGKVSKFEQYPQQGARAEATDEVSTAQDFGEDSFQCAAAEGVERE